jgi:hypothetical protein
MLMIKNISPEKRRRLVGSAVLIALAASLMVFSNCQTCLDYLIDLTITDDNSVEPNVISLRGDECSVIADAIAFFVKQNRSKNTNSIVGSEDIVTGTEWASVSAVRTQQCSGMSDSACHEKIDAIYSGQCLK